MVRPPDTAADHADVTGAISARVEMCITLDTRRQRNQRPDGVDPEDPKYGDIGAIICRLSNEIAETPSATLDELVAKARLYLHFFADDPPESNYPRDPAVMGHALALELVRLSTPPTPHIGA